MTDRFNPFVLMRAKSGLSALAFCRKFDFNYSWYLKVESGKICWHNLTIDNFEKLGRAYGMSLLQLWNALVIYDADSELYDGKEVVNDLVDEPDDFWYV